MTKFKEDNDENENENDKQEEDEQDSALNRLSLFSLIFYYSFWTTSRLSLVRRVTGKHTCATWACEAVIRYLLRLGMLRLSSLTMLPPALLDQFARIPLNTTIENKYYGVYNKILDRTFNTTTDTFTVQPQYPLLQAQTYGVPSVDFVVTYVVAMDERLIFFLEIKPPCHVDDILSRIVADNQMRDRFRSLYDLTPLPRLHSIVVLWDRDSPCIVWTKPPGIWNRNTLSGRGVASRTLFQQIAVIWTLRRKRVMTGSWRLLTMQ